MQGFNQVTIGGYPGGGLVTDRKPMMIADEAFSNLRNAYVWRLRVKKRDGSVTIGRLSIFEDDVSLGTSGTSPFSVTIFATVSPAITLPFAQIQPNTVSITIGTLELVDNGAGILEQGGTITAITQANPGKITSANHHLITGEMVMIQGVGGMTELNGSIYTITVIDANNFDINVNTTTFTPYTTGGTWTSMNAVNFGTINYITSVAEITTNVASGTAMTISFTYFPSLPVMGILKQDVATIGIDNTIYFDTMFAYQFISGGFQQLVSSTPTTWTGTNLDFFWGANYQGADPSLKYFFETNFNLDKSTGSYDPIRYYNNTTWTNLQPLVTATVTLWQALILIPYYGRLVALNVWEGPTSGTFTGASNFSARATFSQIGNPTDQTNGWRRDIFGRGGFIDAPTNESIVSAAFYRNTLIVFFEYSTWELRYIGEYGLPFIFERISSDFGSVSTYSTVVFDQGVMTVSDRGVMQSNASGIKRLDEQIPDTVFGFQIQDGFPNFVHAARDFEKELVYWNYFDTTNYGIFQSYPNTTLVYNYRNNTWAKFRDTITCFGTAQFQLGITWDSLTTFWDSDVSWDTADNQNYAEYVTVGNQQGFISVYENPDASTMIPAPIDYGPSLFIYSIDLSTTPIQIVSPTHNLQSGELIYISGMLWSGTDPGLNGIIYSVNVIDANTFGLMFWNGTNYVDVTRTSSATYIGNGVISLLPVMNIVGKDFNPYQQAGKGFKISYIDFLMDTNNAMPSIPAMTVQLFVNSYVSEDTQANLPMYSNQELLNSSLLAEFIQDAQNTNPCIITSKGHSLITGQQVYIANVIGMTQINQPPAPYYTITVIDANNFSLNGIDATSFGVYGGGGIWNVIPIDGSPYLQGTDYAWYRFYSTQYGQFLRIGLTYDDNLMNQLSTHQTPLVLHAMNCFFREGGRLIN